MSHFLPTLALRNGPLYYFGWICLAAAVVCVVLTQLSTTQVTGINAWVKPLKFFVSTGLFVWTMGWYVGYLPPWPALSLYTWVVVVGLTNVRPIWGSVKHPATFVLQCIIILI